MLICLFLYEEVKNTIIHYHSFYNSVYHIFIVNTSYFSMYTWPCHFSSLFYGWTGLLTMFILMLLLHGCIRFKFKNKFLTCVLCLLYLKIISRCQMLPLSLTKRVGFSLAIYKRDQIFLFVICDFFLSELWTERHPNWI